MAGWRRFRDPSCSVAFHAVVFTGALFNTTPLKTPGWCKERYSDYSQISNIRFDVILVIYTEFALRCFSSTKAPAPPLSKVLQCDRELIIVEKLANNVIQQSKLIVRCFYSITPFISMLAILFSFCFCLFVFYFTYFCLFVCFFILMKSSVHMLHKVLC